MRMYNYVRMCSTPAATTGSGKKSIIAKLRVYSRTHNMESRDRTSRGENIERGGHQPGTMLHSRGVLRMLEKFVYCSVFSVTLLCYVLLKD